MATITLTQDSATIGSTQYYLAANSAVASWQTADVILQVYLDLGALAAGDEFDIKIYEKTDGTNPEVIYYAKVQGAQSYTWVSPSFILGVGWDVSITKIAGTDRSIYWTLAKIG